MIFRSRNGRTAEKAFFLLLLDSGARPYTLWKELEETIPKGVFRRLRIPEPFPEQKHQRQEHRKITPYSRPVPESLAIPPLLSADEMTQLHALHRAEHRTRQ